MDPLGAPAILALTLTGVAFLGVGVAYRVLADEANLLSTRGRSSAIGPDERHGARGRPQLIHDGLPTTAASQMAASALPHGAPRRLS